MLNNQLDNWTLWINLTNYQPNYVIVNDEVWANILRGNIQFLEVMIQDLDLETNQERSSEAVFKYGMLNCLRTNGCIRMGWRVGVCCGWIGGSLGRFAESTGIGHCPGMGDRQSAGQKRE